MATLRLAILLVLAMPGTAQQQGAKALFNDPTSGVALTPQSSPKGRKAAPRPSAPPPIGLKYWLELATGNTVEQVPATRIFRSGDRVRLHLASNADGDLTILQAQDGGPYTLLFPVAGKTAAVRAAASQAFPSRTGWFRFDDKPGAIRLAVMIRAAQAQAQAQAPAQAPKPAPLPPAPPPPVAPAKPPEASATAAAAFEAEVKRELERLRGSKALLVEDESGPGAATYVVVDSRHDARVAPGVVALEIRLTHQAR